MSEASGRCSSSPRWALVWIGVCALLSQIVGSVFNIWYNLLHILPLLTSQQQSAFVDAIENANLSVYPVGAVLLALLLRSLHVPYARSRVGQPLPPGQMLKAQQRAINLGWMATAISTPCWLICIPYFLLTLSRAPGRLDPRVLIHLPVSIFTATLIAQALAFFSIEILTQRYLFPVLFRDTRPSAIPGTFPLSLRGRALLTATVASLCPILSLLLLILAPHPDQPNNLRFAVAVAGVSAAFALVSVRLVSHLLEEPIQALRQGSQAIAQGQREVHLELLRADEFGPLIDEFNHMARDLRDKERVEETFGRHVGRQTARQLLRRRAGLSGEEMEISVMFVDIRGFTTRCSDCTPAEAVELLNAFFGVMVEVIERHGGMVNKFLGDGLMALFGADAQAAHADRALASALEQLQQLQVLNQRLQHPIPIQIGIGIHSGPAVVGSIGSPQRMEYTAIGDTVNVASRVESLTKGVGQELLMSESTYRMLSDRSGAIELPPQEVKGKAEAVKVYAWRLDS